MVTQPERRRQLVALESALRELVGLLRLDRRCRWTSHFAIALDRAEALLADGFTQADLDDLSSSIRHLYGGAGTFGDYTPGRWNPATGRLDPIPGMDRLEPSSSEVYRLADDLRVTGRYEP
jgi:hypothetical protein